MWQTIKSLLEAFFSILKNAQQKQAESDAETGQALEQQVEEEAHGQ